jgi:hypothetical protein
MRFGLDSSREGDWRTRQGFLWWPKVARNLATHRPEVRWLERAKWREYRDVAAGFGGAATLAWVALYWLDEGMIDPGDLG